jgi:hypothetical protein
VDHRATHKKIKTGINDQACPHQMEQPLLSQRKRFRMIWSVKENKYGNTLG